MMTTMNKSVTIPGYPDLTDLICRTYNVTPAQLRARCRSRDISDVRHIMMWAALDVYRMPVVEAGRLADRDDSTAVNSYSRVLELRDSDKAFAAKLSLLTRKLNVLCSTN